MDEPLAPAELPAHTPPARLGLAFIALLIVDTLVVTVLAVLKSERWGWLPLFVPFVLGFIGLVVFKWVPQMRTSPEIEAELPWLARAFFKMSLVVILLSQIAAVLIGLGSLVLLVLMIVMP